MPEVGGRKFNYSKAGRAAARSFAKRTGKTVRSTPSSRRATPTSRRKKKTKRK